MISRLTGSIAHQDLRYVVVDVGGVGYKVYTPSPESHPVGSQGIFWTYLAVRDDALDLYGFSSKECLELFELIITVSGIGPKTALNIMAIASQETIITAISMQDSTYLTKVSGIGKKNAEKIVLELKDKLTPTLASITEETKGKHKAAQNDGDAVEALKALGYSREEAREALKSLDGTVVGTSARIKAALKHLGK
ncbi:MAG: Holliday junction branch migration protein RuvA [Patescibacteria group bacterium]